MQIFWLKGSQFQAEVLFWPNILKVIPHYVCVAYCYISLFFLMAPSECFDLRKKKEVTQWNKPRILLSLRGKSALHRLRAFGFKHLLEAFAWRSHEKPVALSQPLVWIPSWRGPIWALWFSHEMLELTLSSDFRLLMTSTGDGFWDWGTTVCTGQCTAHHIIF